MSREEPAAAKLTVTQWLICTVAAIGFAFDIYELLMAPLVVPPALMELGKFKPGSPEFQRWVALMFYVPAFAGGIFGLLGGYLTDLWGRRRVLVASILLYAGSACAAGFSTSLPMLLFFRSTTFIGVCVEFVAAVAWLAELFPNPKQRESVLGYTQAFSSIGGLAVAGANWIAVHYAGSMPAIYGEHTAWRYTLISGLIPAIPLIIIRPFLPESPAWASKKAAGTLRRPSLAELFAPQLRLVTIVTTIMFACSYGAAFGAIQQVSQIVPGLVAKQVPDYASKPKPEQKKLDQATAANVQMYQEVGGLIGRVAIAYLAIRIVSRRSLLRVFQLPGLVVLPIVFCYAAVTDLTLLKAGIFVVGFFTVAQFSFWGNYLPRMYPTHLRGTGESFAANIGGRMLGTSAVLVTQSLATAMPSDQPPIRLAYAAAAVGLAVYVIGSIACFWLPEPSRESLMD